jgi:hypothetical protein
MESDIIKTKPSINLIAFGILGTLFFGSFTYIVLSKALNVNTDIDLRLIIIWITAAMLAFFTSACFAMLLSLKTITLTHQMLIIKRPLLFYEKIVPIENMRSISEKDYNINPSHDGSKISVYTGRQTIIELTNDKIIKFSSFEIPEYLEIKDRIKRVLNKNLSHKTDIKYHNKESILFFWIILMSLLTIGLIYLIFKGNFKL